MVQLNLAIVCVLLSLVQVASAQENAVGIEPSLEERIEAVRQFPLLHNGLRLEGTGSMTETQNGKPLRNHSFKFGILTNSDGSYRHFTLDAEFRMVSDNPKRFCVRMEGFYDKPYGVLIMNSSGCDGVSEHRSITGYLKTYRPGHLGLVRQGGVLGIVAVDKDTLDVYFPSEVKPVLDKQSDGRFRLVSDVPDLGKCTVYFGAENKIIGYLVEKGSEDTINSVRKERLKRAMILQNEAVSSYRFEVSEIDYSNGYVCKFKSVEAMTGVKGAEHREEGEYTIKVAGTVTPEEPMPSGLAMLREYSDDKEMIIGIRDDPHVRYIPDENGRVRKAVDRRGFDSGRPGSKNPDIRDEKPSVDDKENDGLVYEDYLRTQVPAAHCGVYCLANAFADSNVDFQIKDLLNSKYISRYDGSSQDDLKLACADYGVKAVDVANLTLSTLQKLDSPALLLLDQDSSRPNHWILFKGDRNGKAIILDPPRQEELIDYRYLLTQWKGNALVLGSGDVPVQWSIDAIAERVTLASVPFLLVLCVSIFHRRCKRLPRKFAIQIAGIAAIATISSVCFHHYSVRGFKGIEVAGASLGLNGKTSTNVSHVSVHELRTIANNDDVLIVDARPSFAFLRGNIRNSVNFPVDSRLGEFHDSIDQIMSRNAKRIVVYCQTKHCDWDSIVANKLVRMRFPNVAILKGGFEDWISNAGALAHREARSAGGAFC